MKKNQHQGQHSHSDHQGHDHSHHHGDFKKKFFISLALALPIVFLSPMMGIEMPFQIAFPGSQWVVLALSSLLYFYGGSPFLKGAAEELKAKRPAMMTLISLGISVAYFYSFDGFILREV